MVLTREAPATIETVTPIKPSEALRLGRLVRPRELKGRCFAPDGAACANGAIALGLGYPGPIDEGPNASSDPLVYSWLEDRGVPYVGIISVNDARGNDGDAAVLAYLESKGL